MANTLTIVVVSIVVVIAAVFVISAVVEVGIAIGLTALVATIVVGRSGQGQE